MLQANRSFKFFLLLAAFLISSSGFASFDQMLNFKGTLSGYDQDYVWLMLPASQTKMKAKFNKKYFPSMKGFVVGVAELKVSVPAVEFFALNPSSGSGN